MSKFNKIDLAILAALGEQDEYCFPYSYLERRTGYDRKELKPRIKYLREQGYVTYERGLMSEEGEVAGSGFGVKYGKWQEIREYIEKTPEGIRNRISAAIDDLKYGGSKKEIMDLVEAYAASMCAQDGEE